MTLKMNEIRAVEVALFFMERLSTVEIILHGKTAPLLTINLVLLFASTVLYGLLYFCRLHLRRPSSNESDDFKKYFYFERLGLFLVVLWRLGQCRYGLTLGRAVLLFSNLMYLDDYLGYIFAEDKDDDNDETQGKVKDNQEQRQKGEEHQVAGDNVHSNEEETKKKENSDEFPQVVTTSFEDWLYVDVNGTEDDKYIVVDEEKEEKVDGDGDGDGDENKEEEEYEDADFAYDDYDDEEEEGENGADIEHATEENRVQEELQELRVKYDNLKKEKDLLDQAQKMAQELYDTLQTDLEAANASSEYHKKFTLRLMNNVLERCFIFQAQRKELKTQVQDLKEKLDAAMQSLDSYRDVIRDFEEAYDEKIKEKNSLIADLEEANALIDELIAKLQQLEKDKYKGLTSQPPLAENVVARI